MNANYIKVLPRSKSLEWETFLTRIETEFMQRIQDKEYL